MSYQIHTDIPYEGTWVQEFENWEDLVTFVKNSNRWRYDTSIYEIVREVPIEEVLK